MMKRAAVAAKSIYSGCSRLSVARNCNFQDSLQTGSNRYHVSSAGWSPSDPPSTTTTTTCTSSPGLERTGSGWSDMTFLPMSFLHIVVILVVLQSKCLLVSTELLLLYSVCGRRRRKSNYIDRKIHYLFRIENHPQIVFNSSHRWQRWVVVG